MKHLLFATALLLMITASAFAGGNNKTNMFKDFSAALRTANQTAYKTTDAFRGTSFTYNGKTIHAYYDRSNDDLIGFSVPLNANDLPAGMLESVEKKYSGWQLTEAMMFVDDNSISYFISVSKPNKAALVLKIGANNYPVIYAKM